ncbi:MULTISPECIES: hypothetical protein [unclassified Caballeronia]|uniref:hypothetical protein n=1 Tax=unclassified Caballeronia TaxID=2646786 RepID=UPI00285E150E|nr:MULTISPECIES: hypothetical protein [unclassified Caballeronia]MDR5740648.1 hypothetical protein [Caballeronia sp. LZ016]MDR5808829.1 hypothetical protein [Caballeronia sp. LZ019]
MPEQITKYPDVTLRVLKGAGAVCGDGAPQKILKQCPADRFCSLPSGEICVYGIAEIPRMTQVDAREVAAVVSPRFTFDRSELLTLWGLGVVVLVVGLLLGFVAGRYAKK